MGKLVVLQSNFTRGELDPRLIARTDTDLYRKGCKRIKNALVIPQGGIKRRPGQKWIAEIADVSNNQISFTSFEFSSSVGYLLVFIDSAIYIFYNDAQVATVASPWPGAVVTDLRFTQSADTMFISHPDYKPRKLVRTVPHTGWDLSIIDFSNVPTHDFLHNYDAIAFSPSVTTGAVTLTATAAIFTAAYIGGVFSGNRGTMRITGFIDSTHVTGYTLVDFANTGSISGKDSFLAEPAWSDTRGWPNAVTLYEDRLWFGGSKQLPQTIWASQVSDYYNFDFGTGLDAEAIGVTINTTKSNNIQYLVSGRTLSLFTDGAEFTAPQSDDRPLTPKTISIRQQSENGTAKVLPKQIDNKILYVQAGGKKVRSYIFNIQQQAYGSEDVSILAAHLIKNPVDSAVLKNSPVEDAEYYYLINSDGTLVAFQTIEAQQVAAWSEADTQGTYLRIASVNSDIYVAIRRTVNSTPFIHIEKMDASYFTDSATKQHFVSPSSTVASLGFLEGRTVKVKADGFVLQDRVVTGGQITLEQAVTDVEVGLGFDVEVELLPPPMPNNMQINAYTKKKVSRFFVDYYETLGIYVNGILVPFLEFGNHVLDQAPIPKTGFSEVGFMSEFNPRETVTITQKDPLPFLLLGTAMEVTLNG